jgi:hypothetical protein
MAMTEFEKKLISELKGIRNELHNSNKIKSEKEKLNAPIATASENKLNPFLKVPKAKVRKKAETST